MYKKIASFIHHSFVSYEFCRICYKRYCCPNMYRINQKLLTVKIQLAKKSTMAIKMSKLSWWLCRSVRISTTMLAYSVPAGKELSEVIWPHIIHRRVLKVIRIVIGLKRCTNIVYYHLAMIIQKYIIQYKETMIYRQYRNYCSCQSYTNR